MDHYFSRILNFILTKRWPLIALAISTALFGFFLELTLELHYEKELEVLNFDKEFLIYLSTLRMDILNGPAVDLTALGSITVLTIFTLISFFILRLNKNHKGMLYLLIGAIGAGTLSYLMKIFFSRPRPTEVEKLVEVASFSYPSGHSLAASSFYLLIAFLTFRRYSSFKNRFLIILSSVVLISAIGFSRIYLGVHYPSDVAAGLLLGSSWTFLLTAIFYGRS